MGGWVAKRQYAAKMSEHPPDDAGLAEVGRYEKLSLARERALVVAAMELAHCVAREGRFFVLRVEEPAREAVLRELERFEAEQAMRSQAGAEAEAALPRAGGFSLYIAGWLMAACWLVQNWIPPEWWDNGTASSRAIVNEGQWWRALTALTLHGDLSHVGANIASGLLFGAFVLPRLGTGLAWLLIVLSGFVGNLLNAWFYRAADHDSIGASTAVFGALGLLVGWEVVARLTAPARRSAWQLILPLGGGLALLAFLGASDGEQHHTDYMAHLWGLLAGILPGALCAWTRARERLPEAGQMAAAVLAPGLLVLGWMLVRLQGAG